LIAQDILAERLMPDPAPEPEPETVIRPGPAAEAEQGGAPGDDAGLCDPLLEPFQRWDERYLRGQDVPPESLGIDDPTLLEALKARIEEQKALYKFMNFVPGAAEGAAQPEVPVGVDARREVDQPAQAEAAKEEGGSPRPPPVPTSIGKYKVTRVLGQGGYGRVYLAYDAELERQVAIKVPIRERPGAFMNAQAYLDEARILARLSHPNIVPVYEAGRDTEGRVYVVSKFIDGGDLAGRLSRGRYSHTATAELIAVLAEALHYAHTHDLFHRDIKPANILIDSSGVPCLADFGLALKEQNLGTGSRMVGTSAYMSPEQARGEGHLVDGRSDIFSLGIVLYEMLAGRRPFRGSSRGEIMQKIINDEPRPPRQIDDTIPRELERICLKALARRASERYPTARDLADDLRHFLQTRPASVSTPFASPVPPAPGPDGALAPVSAECPRPPSGTSDSDRQSIKIVPKGLCSFDEHDSDFFLELLPGPRDRDGLPDGLRFWKTRIEATDPDKTFRVGLIYGPSGCGKSSLVKAGLLPRLRRHVSWIYIEATGDQTEARLHRALRKAFPEADADGSLVQSLAALRHGQGLPPSGKVIVILDQFEQWLFSRRDASPSELVAALRQCDGEHVQALCLLRDDFWMAATRFMRDLEIDLVPDRNVAAVDLFDPKHARKVLAAYGRAYDALPAGGGGLTREQNSFLDEAVAGLTQDGRVVPVRLALFAEMVKAKPWSPATLRALGGMEGVGAKFLEETFCSPRSSLQYRFHQKGAQAVLKSLLPQSNADIKGQMRSIDELRELSGYAQRPDDFGDLIRILDHHLRLITPVDLETSIDEDTPAALPAGKRYYQLAHDYLVHSLRDWLTQKQRETLKGRAELRLKEHADLWESRPERRFLPSWSRWCMIQMMTSRPKWSVPERAMMRAATRLHAVRAAAIAALLAAAAAGGIWLNHRLDERHEQTVADGRVRQLMVADMEQIGGIIDGLQFRPDRSRPALAAIAADPARTPEERFRAHLALLPYDPAHVGFVLGRVPEAEPGELLAIRRELRRLRPAETRRLWDMAANPGAGTKGRFRAACVLAELVPDAKEWGQIAAEVAKALLKESPLQVERWVNVLRPVRAQLLEPLASIAQSHQHSEVERSLALPVLADFAADRPDILVGLIKLADPAAFDLILTRLESQRELAVPLLTEVLGAKLPPDRPDPFRQASSGGLSNDVVEEIERAKGLLGDRFALCHTLPLERFASVAGGLRGPGYRPVRVRPYAVGGGLRVAAVWIKDGRDWEFKLCAGEAEAREQDRARRARGYEPVDIAAYWTAQRDKAHPALSYAVVWVKAESVGSARDAQLFVGVTEPPANRDAAMPREELTWVTLQRVLTRDGRPLYSGIALKSAEETVAAADDDVHEYETRLFRNGAQEDICLDAAPEPSSFKARQLVNLERAEAKLRSQPDDSAALRARADALYRLGRYSEVLDATSRWINRSVEAAPAYYYRALARANLGAREEAGTDVARYAAYTDQGKGAATALEALVAIYSGRAAEGLAKLESSLPEHMSHSRCLYLYSRAYAVAARIENEKKRSAKLVDRAVALLKGAINHGFADYSDLGADPDFESVWTHPVIRQIFGPMELPLRYAAVWGNNPRWESAEAHGVSPEEHVTRCRELAKEGYQPAAISVIEPRAAARLASASVWRRPHASEQECDDLARGKSRAAVALARLGRSEPMWRLLAHAPDPTLRTYLIQDLAELGIDTHTVIERLETETDTSTRRALLLALDGFLDASLSGGARRRLEAKLEQLYTSDPDAGVHSCARWILGRMGLGEKVKGFDTRLAGHAPQAERDWFVNAEGMTFTIVRRPAEFQMGAPLQEPNSNPHEARHLVRIPRSFAVCTTEVTGESFAHFLRDNPQFRPEDNPSDRAGPQGPINMIDVFEAAAFCRWLGDRDRISEKEQCYPPVAEILQAEREGRLPLPAGYLQRSGYRLPTEAEWEYAARAGSQVSRPFGRSLKMLPLYAWTPLSASEHPHPVGELRPNDLGLFDVLGNVWEWCQDDGTSFRPNFGGLTVVDQEELPSISERAAFMRRGGAYNYAAPLTRCANRLGYTTDTKTPAVGFRIVCTIR
jgi:serine/threonine protein kinase/formylglycine-generating enzyme required for sulfatase activity